MATLRNLFTVFLFIFSFGAQSAHSAEPIGIASVVMHDVTINRDGLTAPLSATKGAEIFSGDVITTISDDSFVRIDFVDETNITMNGEQSELTIDEYIFDPKSVDMSKAKFQILRGSFEFVGGLIDKGEGENVQIDLDFGSIGVRGTKILRAMRDKECWIFLEDGEIRVFNDAGEVFLKPGDGTRMRDTAIAPTDVKPWGQKNIDWIKSEVALPAE